MRPITPLSSPESPPTKKLWIKSPRYTARNLQSTSSSKCRMNTPFKRSRPPRRPRHHVQGHRRSHQTAPRDDEEINIDLPVSLFVYHRDNKHWIFIKRSISKYSRTSLSRTRLFRITAYLEVKMWSLF